jgi:hypothetical protein
VWWARGEEAGERGGRRGRHGFPVLWFSGWARRGPCGVGG